MMIPQPFLSITFPGIKNRGKGLLSPHLPFHMHLAPSPTASSGSGEAVVNSQVQSSRWAPKTRLVIEVTLALCHGNPDTSK